MSESLLIFFHIHCVIIDKPIYRIYVAKIGIRSNYLILIWNFEDFPILCRRKPNEPEKWTINAIIMPIAWFRENCTDIFAGKCGTNWVQFMPPNPSSLIIIFFTKLYGIDPYAKETYINAVRFFLFFLASSTNCFAIWTTLQHKRSEKWG